MHTCTLRTWPYIASVPSLLLTPDAMLFQRWYLPLVFNHGYFTTSPFSRAVMRHIFCTPDLLRRGPAPQRLTRNCDHAFVHYCRDGAIYQQPDPGWRAYVPVDAWALPVAPRTQDTVPRVISHTLPVQPYLTVALLTLRTRRFTLAYRHAPLFCLLNNGFFIDMQRTNAGRRRRIIF